MLKERLANDTKRNYKKKHNSRGNPEGNFLGTMGSRVKQVDLTVSHTQQALDFGRVALAIRLYKFAKGR